MCEYGPLNLNPILTLNSLNFLFANVRLGWKCVRNNSHCKKSYGRKVRALTAEDMLPHQKRKCPIWMGVVVIKLFTVVNDIAGQ